MSDEPKKLLQLLRRIYPLVLIIILNIKFSPTMNCQFVKYIHYICKQ